MAKRDRLLNLQGSVIMEIPMVMLFYGESPGVPEPSVYPNSLVDWHAARLAVLHKQSTGVLAHKVLCGTGITLPSLDGTLTVATEAYPQICAMAAAPENLAAQLHGGFALDTPYINRILSIDNFLIYTADSGLIIETGSSVATLKSI
jgi:hypothetical protein